VIYFNDRYSARRDRTDAGGQAGSSPIWAALLKPSIAGYRPRRLKATRVPRRRPPASGCRQPGNRAWREPGRPQDVLVKEGGLPPVSCQFRQRSDSLPSTLGETVDSRRRNWTAVIRLHVAKNQ